MKILTQIWSGQSNMTLKLKYLYKKKQKFEI